MYSALSAWGYSKQPSSIKSSRGVGGRGRKMRGPLPSPGCSPSKFGWNRAKSYCHLYGAPGHCQREAYIQPLAMIFIGLNLTQSRSGGIRNNKNTT
ncbi:hypothetical protein TNCV_4775291 [Trichonephila clavipes]|nr:hypothetical protein TNCV_4775291 [Trichonephila clavipes]